MYVNNTEGQSVKGNKFHLTQFAVGLVLEE
jgi:hypothetical protein